MKSIAIAIFMFELMVSLPVEAQAPAGSIVGIVNDALGAVVPGAGIIVENKDMGFMRSVLTTAQGEYSVPALSPGQYDVAVEAPGFQPLVRIAIVEAGSATTLHFTVQVGAVLETVNVEAAVPQIRYDSHTIGGVITRVQIEDLPLNGRSFLELSKLEPGAQQPTRASNNRMLVPLLGAPVGQNGRATRLTVDGGSIMQVGNGGTAMGFSQEVVQEFQVSTVNLDLSTGTTASGAVNIATRSGSNELHGSAFFSFRDHHLSAYPGLARDDFNPDPFFQRRQFGVTLAGPIRKDRAFFFGTLERNEQRGVVSTQLLTPEFAALSRITASPNYVNQFSIRTDVRLAEHTSAFLRHSHEGISSFANISAARLRALPSAWTRQPGWADQSILGLTSASRSNLVNDLRFSYFFVSSAEQAPRIVDCPGCLGIGVPSISVMPDLFIGSSMTTRVLGRRYHLNDVVAWSEGRHRIRFGGDWEIARGGATVVNDEPVSMTLFSPSEVKNFNESPSTPVDRRIALPASFSTVQDILQLPVQSFSVGIGEAYVPQKGFGKTRVTQGVHLFYQDAWQLHRQLTVNYGLGWTYDAPLNYDLRKPSFLAPILGEQGLGPTRKNWRQFSPSAGFAWSVREDGKTVLRGGAGIYYDFRVPFGTADPERVSMGPRGVGRGTYQSVGIRNPLPDVPGVPAGTLLNVLGGNPTHFTGAVLMRALPAIRTNLTEQRGDPNNRDFSLTNIEVDRTGSLVSSDLSPISATHASLGVQREVAQDLVLSADFVLRRYAPLGAVVDLNHYSSARGPALPGSLGPIRVFSSLGRARYQGLHIRADKRFARRWQFLGSYAYSSNVGSQFQSGFNLETLQENFGPLDRDVRHILNLSGLVRLPRGFQFGVFATYNSKPPFSPILGGLDLDGDGSRGDLLPGTTVNQFNRSFGKEDLYRLVNQFNSNYAGKRDAQGRNIRSVTLPTDFEFDDRLFTHDVRLSRTWTIGEQLRLTLIGDVFNLFNRANLSGRSGDLLSTGFGQPTSRITQVFGSGGPRSFQVAARVSF